MREDVNKWYVDNKQYLDFMINKIFVNLKRYIYMPKSVSCRFTFDWEHMFDDMVEYLYDNR